MRFPSTLLDFQAQFLTRRAAGPICARLAGDRDSFVRDAGAVAVTSLRRDGSSNVAAVDIKVR